MASTADIPPAVTTDDRIDLPVDARRRGFWFGLTFALLVHSLLIIGIRHASPRYIGDPSGAPDAIAVDLVTEADLQSREIVALPPPGAKTQPTPPPQPEMKAAPEPQPEQPVEKPAETPTEQPVEKPVEKAAPETPAEQPAPEPPKETPKSEAEKEATDPNFDLPDLTSLEDLTQKKQDKDPTKTKDEKKADEKPTEQKPTEQKPTEQKPTEEQKRTEQQKPAEQKKPEPAKKPATKPAPKDQELAMSMPPPGGGVSRPPGITRSGENDEFGRGVIRALRATMPPPLGMYGRVTVRLFLNDRGDLTEVKLLESSGSKQLDQSVVFATQQTNFPLPPRGSTVADRTFIISYVYRLSNGTY